MIIYVIIAFVAILIGMAISVSAFGTGGKRKKIFQDIYFSVEDVDGIGVLYTKTGEYSAILKMENPVQKYSANIDSYYEFNHLVTALAQTLGEGYAIHKQDVYFQHFKGGKYKFIHSAFDSETQERMVVYQALYGDQAYWVRPEKMFFGKVTRDGRTFNRFTEIDIK